MLNLQPQARDGRLCRRRRRPARRRVRPQSVPRVVKVPPGSNAHKVAAEARRMESGSVGPLGSRSGLRAVIGTAGGMAESALNMSWGNATLSVSCCFFLLHDVRLYSGKMGAFCEELPSRKALVMSNWHFRAGQVLHYRLVSIWFIVKSCICTSWKQL